MRKNPNIFLAVILLLACNGLFASRLTSVRYTLPSKVEYCINDTFFVKVKNITRSKLANVNLYNVFSIYKNRYDSSIAPISYTGNTLGLPATINNKGHVSIFLKDTLYAGETIEIGIIGKLNCTGYQSYYDTSALANIIQVSYKSGNVLKTDITTTTIYNPQIPVLVISNVTPSTQNVIHFQPYFIDIDVVNGGFGDLSAFVLKLKYNKPQFQTKVDSIEGNAGILLRNDDTTASIYISKDVFLQQLSHQTMHSRERITLRIYLHNQTCSYIGIVQTNVSAYLICPGDTFSFCDTTKSPKDFFVNYQAKPKQITVTRDVKDRDCIIAGTNNIRREIVIKNTEEVPLDSINIVISSSNLYAGSGFYASTPFFSTLDTSTFKMRYNNGTFVRPAFLSVTRTDTAAFRLFDLSVFDTLPPATRAYVIDFYTQRNAQISRYYDMYYNCYQNERKVIQTCVRMPDGSPLQPGDSITLRYESQMCDGLDLFCESAKYINISSYALNYYEPCVRQYLTPVELYEEDLDNFESYQQVPKIILIGNLASYNMATPQSFLNPWYMLQKTRQDDPVRHYQDSVYYQNSAFMIEMRLSDMLDYNNQLPIIKSNINGVEWPADYKTVNVIGNEKIYQFYWRYNGPLIDTIFRYYPYNSYVNATIYFPTLQANCNVRPNGPQYVTRTDYFYVQPKENCIPNLLPLTQCSTTTKVDVYCPKPGCAFPYMSVMQASLERINLGLKDNNNDGIPDDSTTALKTEVMHLNTYVAGDTMLATHLLQPVNIAPANTSFKEAYSYIQFSEDAPAKYWQSAGGKIVFYDKNTNTHYRCTITAAQFNLDTSVNRWYINCSPKAYSAQFPALANLYFKTGDSVNVFPLFRFNYNLERNFLNNELYMIHTYLSDSALNFETLSTIDNNADLLSVHIYKCSFTFNYINLMGYIAEANFHQLAGQTSTEVKYCNDRGTLFSSFDFGMPLVNNYFFFGNEVRDLVKPKKQVLVFPKQNGYVVKDAIIELYGENTPYAYLSVNSNNGLFNDPSTINIIRNINDSTVEINVPAFCQQFNINTYQLGEYNHFVVRFTLQPVCNKPIHFDAYPITQSDVVRTKLFLDDKANLSGRNSGDTLFSNYLQYRAFTGDTVVQFYDVFPDKIYQYRDFPSFLFNLLVYSSPLNRFDSIYGRGYGYTYLNRFISAVIGNVEATDNPNPVGANRVAWDFQVTANNITNPVYRNTFLDSMSTAYNPYLIIRNPASFSNIKVVRMYGDFDTISGPIYKLDTTGNGFRDPEKYPFRIIADVNSCFDSMQVLLGFNCTAYPTSLQDTLICNKQSLTLYSNFNAATLQAAFITQPDTIRLCDTATVEFKVTSSNLDNVLKILNTVVLPSGFSIVPNTSMVKFPDSTAYVPTMNPQHIPNTTKYIYYTDSVLPSIKNSGLFGYNYIFNHLDALDSNLYAIKFTIAAQCNGNTLQSGYKMALTVNGQSACGKPTKPVRIYSDALYIQGAQKLYDADLDIPRTRIKVCTDDVTQSIVSFLNIGPLATGSNDSLSIILPQGVTLQDSAVAIYNPTNQHLGQYHISVPNDGIGTKYTIKVPQGIAEGDSLIFAIKIHASSSLNCGELPLQMETFNKAQVRCYLDGALCLANQNTGNIEAQLDITKPNLIIQHFNIINIATQGATKDTLTIRSVILNIGDTIFANTPISFSIYGDVNSSHALENGIDFFIDTISFRSGLNTGSSITLIKKIVVNKNEFCSFILAQDTTCACALPQANTTLVLPLKNAGDDVSICSDKSVSIGNAQVAGFTYSWSPSTYLLTPNASQTQLIPINHSAKIDTLKYVLTTQTNSSACIYTDTVNVIVYPKIDTIINKIICRGDSIRFGDAYVKSEGFYVQNLLSKFGCDSIVRLNLSLTGNCVCPTINAIISDKFFCTKNVSATATVTDFTDVQWSLNRDFTQVIANTVGFTAIQNNPVQTYYLKVENAGCIRLDSITLFNNSISFSKSDKVICDTGTVNINLQVNTPVGYTVQWNIGDSAFQTINTTQISYFASQSQMAYFMIRNNKNCAMSDSFKIIRNDIPLADVSADAELVAAGTTVQLQTPFNGNYAYVWIPANSVSNSTIYNPTTQPVQNTWYYVKVTDRNDCKNEDSILIRVQQSTCDAQFFIPNAFTPNNDGVNDVFLARYPCPLDEFYMTVYDRWGLQVFESRDINTGWDGNFKGAREQAEVYAYYVEYRAAGSTVKVVKKGNVTLLE